VTSPLLRRAHPPDADGCRNRVTREQAGWRYLTYAVHQLDVGQRYQRAPDDDEVGVVILEGSADVRIGPQEWSALGSRGSVFDGPPPPVILAQPGREVEVTAAHGGALVAVASAPGGEVRVTRLVDESSMRIEERGRGNTARRVHHLLPPDAEAGRLILVEVFTPGGNWSSYPPHKHDTEDPPREALLEELYHYRFARPGGYALARIYTADRSLDETLAPGQDDLVLVPRGYHPVGMPAGYDGWYLNAMAGPARRWNFTLDPDHAWLMDWTTR
jgi:5-deoxy-glucuronate isomerase